MSFPPLNLNTILFVLLALGAIGSAMMTVTRKNPVASAMYLVMHFFMLAGLYLSLNAQFTAIVQILVYAGAIMVLVVFVIMLLNLGDEDKLLEKYNVRTMIGMFASGVFIALIIPLLRGLSPKISDASLQIGTTENIGTVLFRDYLFPFEAVSLLLLTAIVGAVILAKRKIED